MLRHAIWEEFYQILLTGNGYKNISVREICQKVGIHHTSFYYHFQDKQGLFEYGIDYLLKAYFEVPAKERLNTPFTTSDIFYRDSPLIKLIESQKYDREGLLLITRGAKERMISDAENYLLTASVRSVNGIVLELAARQLIETIFVISQWQENQSYSLAELDRMYLILVGHLLPS